MATYEVLLIPAEDAEPVRRVAVEHDNSLTELQALVEGNIEALPIPEDDHLTAYINEEGKVLELPPNRRATRLIGPIMFAGDHIAGPTIVCGFDPDDGRNRDCPPGLEERLSVRRELPVPTGSEQRQRSIIYSWRLNTDADGGLQLATLSIHHHRAGVSMLSGRQHGSEFTATLANQTERAAGRGFSSVEFRLGSGLIIHREPVARFSAKRLTAAAETALALLAELYGDSDPRVTRYFRVANGGSL